jgi:hypothetical protein
VTRRARILSRFALQGTVAPERSCTCFGWFETSTRR